MDSFYGSFIELTPAQEPLVRQPAHWGGYVKVHRQLQPPLYCGWINSVLQVRHTLGTVKTIVSAWHGLGLGFFDPPKQLPFPHWGGPAFCLKKLNIPRATGPAEVSIISSRLVGSGVESGGPKVSPEPKRTRREPLIAKRNWLECIEDLQTDKESARRSVDLDNKYSRNDFLSKSLIIMLELRWALRLS
jgi:hypothetical protein